MPTHNHAHSKREEFLLNQDMNHHDEFKQRLDAAILSGQSLSKIARAFQINQTTVSRRKASLRDAGHRISNTPGSRPESLRHRRGVNHDAIANR